MSKQVFAKRRHFLQAMFAAAAAASIGVSDAQDEERGTTRKKSAKKKSAKKKSAKKKSAKKKSAKKKAAKKKAAKKKAVR